MKSIALNLKKKNTQHLTNQLAIKLNVRRRPHLAGSVNRQPGGVETSARPANTVSSVERAGVSHKAYK